MVFSITKKILYMELVVNLFTSCSYTYILKMIINKVFSWLPSITKIILWASSTNYFLDKPFMFHIVENI